MISIIVITYNRSNILHKCLESLHNQKYNKRNYEILVIDDGSIDNTVNVVRSMQKRVINLIYYKQQHKGYAMSRNLGIKKAKGSIIAFIDDDCIASQNWLKKINDAYKKNKGVYAIGGKTRSLLQNNKYGKFREYLEYFCIQDRIKLCKNSSNSQSIAQKIYSLPTCNLTFKKNIFKIIGHFNTKYSEYPCEDDEFNWRLFKKGYFILFDPEIEIKHLHADNLSKFIKKSFNDGLGTAIVKKVWKDFPANTLNSPKEMIFLIGGFLIMPIFEIQVIKNFTERLFYLPLFYLHEFTYRCGIVYGYFIN